MLFKLVIVSSTDSLKESFFFRNQILSDVLILMAYIMANTNKISDLLLMDFRVDHPDEPASKPHPFDHAGRYVAHATEEEPTG